MDADKQRDDKAKQPNQPKPTVPGHTAGSKGQDTEEDYEIPLSQNRRYIPENKGKK